jgi:hypothetical protein
MSRKRKRDEGEVPDDNLDLIMADFMDVELERASAEQGLRDEMLDYEQSVMKNLEKEASEQDRMIDEKAVMEDQMNDQEFRDAQSVSDDDRDLIMFELFVDEMDERETAFEHDRMHDEDLDYAQEMMNEAALEQFMLDEEHLNYERSVVYQDLQRNLAMAEELIREEELAQDEILEMEYGELQHLDYEKQLTIQSRDEQCEAILRNQEMDAEEYDPSYTEWITREEQWSTMNTEWFSEESFTNNGRLVEDLTKDADETNERVKREWIAQFRKSIMNEEWRTIIDGVMDDRFFSVGEMSTIEKATAADQDSWNEEAMAYDQSTRSEEAMDYEQSIMNETTGWYNAAPAKSEQLTSKFDYTRLDQPEHEIRLICLHPRRWLTDSTITCEITTVDLSTAPQYEALSYEWGSPSSIEYTIQLNQKAVAVRQNLWRALYDLRDTRESRTLWIDTLCINQTNVHERNCQVSRMGSIYSQAARVVAWIGQDDYESRYGLVFLAELAATSPKKYCPPYGECPDGKHRGKWQAMSSLFNRSYWSRLWIIQEVVLASQLRIQCGTLSFDWEDLAMVFHHLGKSKTGSCAPRSRLSIVSSVPFRLEMQRRDQQMAVLENTNGNLIPLLDLLDLFKDASCFDARDKIFGLKSLSSSCCRDAVQTDYSMEYEDVLDTLSAHHEAKHH